MFPQKINSRTLVWVNRIASRQGGAERYIQETLKGFRKEYPGWKHHLLYTPGTSKSSFLKAFDSAWAVVNTEQMEQQLKAIDPDAVYMHQLPLNVDLRRILSTCKQNGWSTLRFLHDHQLFCLREHKYTAVSKNTCTRTTGMKCYACLGFVGRQAGSFQFKRLANLKQQQREHQAFDHLIVASDYLKSHAVQHGFSKSQIKVIPLFHHQDEITVSPSPSLEAPYTFLFVGQLLKGKGIDTLLNALHQLPQNSPDYILKIVGSGNEEAELKQQVQKLGLEQRVSFEGYQHDLKPYWAQANMLILPSRSPETFGLVGLEAMASGIPVIASHVGGISEWLKEGENGHLFPSGNSTLLAQRLENALQNPSAAHQKGLRGFKRWQAHFQRRQHILSLAQHLNSFQRTVQNVA